MTCAENPPPQKKKKKRRKKEKKKCIENRRRKERKGEEKRRERKKGKERLQGIGVCGRRGGGGAVVQKRVQKPLPRPGCPPHSRRFGGGGRSKTLP